MQEQRSLRRIAFAAAAATTALFLAAAVYAEPAQAGASPSDPPSPGQGSGPAPKSPARVAIDACHVAIERELLGKNPNGEKLVYEGDSVYYATIEIIVNGSLKRSAQSYDYTCRYNERSEQTYGVKLEKRS